MHQSALPDIAGLQAFAALAETGSFAAAANLLGRDPTIVSRRIQALEKHLGVRLADRTTRQVVFTEAGHAFFARVRPLLEELGAASLDASAFASGEPRGRLRVALPTSFGRQWLAPLIVGFAEAHPAVSIETDYSNRFVDLFAQGYDLAVRLAELPDSRLIARKVASRRRLLCAAPAYLARRPPISAPDELAEHDCLCFTGRDDFTRWNFTAPDGSSANVVVAARMAADDADVLIEAAIAGLGLFYTVDWHAGPHIAAGTLVPVLEDWGIPDDGGVYVVTPARGAPPKTRAFSDWIAKGLNPEPWRRA